MSYELKEEVSFDMDKELWLGNLRFDFYDNKETLCNKFFPSDLIYELDKQEVISLKKIQEEVNLIQFDMIKNYNKKGRSGHEKNTCLRGRGRYKRFCRYKSEAQRI